MNSSKSTIVISGIIEKVQLIGGIFLIVVFGIFAFRRILDDERIINQY